MSLAHHVHTIVDIPVNVIVEGAPTDLPGPGTPQSIKYTSMPSCRNCGPMTGLPADRPEYRPVDQGIRDEDGNVERLLHHRGEAIQDQIVLSDNLFFGTHPNLNVLVSDMAQALDSTDNLTGSGR